MPADTHGRLRFLGGGTAELFTREVEDSFLAVMARNLVRQPDDPNAGFVHASVDGRPFTGTMWSRDMGTFLRELVQWGYLDEALLTVNQAVRLVEKDENGYFMFPEYFDLGVPGSGTELDGTAAFLIAAIQLCRRMPLDSPRLRPLLDFLLDAASPLVGMLDTLETAPFMAGSGEFGRGCQLPGGCTYNVVQNNMVWLTLIAAAPLLDKLGEKKTAKRCRETADRLMDNLLRYFVDDAGCFIWTVDRTTLRPDDRVNNEPVNKGAGLLNGVLSMTADVLGLDVAARYPGYEAGRRTMERLNAHPLRRRLFEEYGGLWSQFEEFWPGATCPSYGQGYAIQSLLLLDNREMADKAVDFTADIIYNPLPEYKLTRDSRTHIHEIFYTPYSVGRMELVEACGALNLVGVSEMAKVARMLAGLDDTADDVLAIRPRIPAGWQGFAADNWPMARNGRVWLCDIRYDKQASPRLTLSSRSGEPLPPLIVALDGEATRFDAGAAVSIP